MKQRCFAVTLHCAAAEPELIFFYPGNLCLFFFNIPTDTKKNQQTALIGATAGASGAFFIAAVVLAVVFVKYRLARRLKNRNKVGDLYTTQEDQLSRKNAYIMEEDMVEKNDAL